MTFVIVLSVAVTNANGAFLYFGALHPENGEWVTEMNPLCVSEGETLTFGIYVDRENEPNSFPLFVNVDVNPNVGNWADTALTSTISTTSSTWLGQVDDPFAQPFLTHLVDFSIDTTMLGLTTGDLFEIPLVTETNCADENCAAPNNQSVWLKIVPEPGSLQLSILASIFFYFRLRKRK